MRQAGDSSIIGRMTRISILVAGVFLLAASAQAQDLYKWVDEDGNVTYQDSPPPGDTGAAKPFAEDAEVAAEAENDALPDVSVTLYSVPICDSCDLVRNLLQKYGVPFDEKDASDDVAVQAEVREIAGQLTVPVLAVGDSMVTGYSSSGITAELTSAGFTPVREGAPANTDTGNAPQGGLTEEEVAQQAAEAAAQLTADLEELPDDASFQEDVVEEIPEEEQIKVKLGE